MGKRNINMGNRYNQQYDSRDSNGSNRSSALDFGSVSVEFWKPEEGRNKINIIPFEIKSPNHPEVANGSMKVGDFDFVLDIWVHQYLGPAKVDLLCVNKTYGKRCMVCEERSRLYDAKKEKEAKELSPSRRVYYNVQPMTKNGLADKCSILHVSHYLFGKELMSEAKACTDGKGVIQFANPDSSGKLVVFRGEMEQKGDNECLVYKSFQFNEREEELSDEVLDSAISLDALLKVPTIKQQEAAMWGEDEDGEEPQEGSHQETSQQRSATPPPKGRGGESSQPEETAQETRGGKKKSDEDIIVDCPQGHEFGKDCDKKNSCSKCPDNVYDACKAYKNRK